MKDLLNVTWVKCMLDLIMFMRDWLDLVPN